MPYKTKKSAKDSGWKLLSLDDVSLTISQINYIANIYDELKKDENIDNPMGVAISKFRENYEISGNKWVKNKEGENVMAEEEKTEDVVKGEVDDNEALEQEEKDFINQMRKEKKALDNNILAIINEFEDKYNILCDYIYTDYSYNDKKTKDVITKFQVFYK